MEPPVLEGERIALFPPDVRFAEDVYKYSKDPEFCRYIDAAPPDSLADSTTFLENLEGDNRTGRRNYWMIRLKDTGRVIGTIGLIFDDNDKLSPLQMGYGIGRDWWGSGLFQEAVALVASYAFDVLARSRIDVLTRKENIKSVKGIEKAGFRHEQVLEGFYRGSRPDDAVLLSMHTNTAGEVKIPGCPDPALAKG